MSWTARVNTVGKARETAYQFMTEQQDFDGLFSKSMFAQRVHAGKLDPLGFPEDAVLQVLTDYFDQKIDLLKRKAANENFSEKWAYDETSALEERLKEKMYPLLMKASNIYMDVSSLEENEVNMNHVDGQLAMRDQFFKKYFPGETFDDWNQELDVPVSDGSGTVRIDSAEIIGHNLDILAAELSEPIAKAAEKTRQAAMLRS